MPRIVMLLLRITRLTATLFLKTALFLKAVLPLQPVLLGRVPAIEDTQLKRVILLRRIQRAGSQGPHPRPKAGALPRVGRFRRMRVADQSVRPATAGEQALVRIRAAAVPVADANQRARPRRKRGKSSANCGSKSTTICSKDNSVA